VPPLHYMVVGVVAEEAATVAARGRREGGRPIAAAGCMQRGQH